MTTKHGELTTLWPHNTLNKVASQATYPGLPIAGAAHKRDKITLPKAVAKENNRGSIALVQKAGRVSERVKKRAIIEEARGDKESADQEVTRAVKRARVTIRAPRRSGRHI